MSLRILFVSGWFPYPPSNGSKLRIYNLLHGLAQRHHVSLLTFADEPMEGSPPLDLQKVCQVVKVVPTKKYNPSSFKALTGFLLPTPRVITDTYSPAMDQAIRDELSRSQYHLVIASEWVCAAYWPAFGEHPALLDELEVGVMEAKLWAAPTWFGRLRHFLPLLKLRHYLPRLLSHYSVCTVVSNNEAGILHRLAEDYPSVEVVPNGVNLANYAGITVRRRPELLIFTGSLSYFANHDAMVWFLGEIYPSIQAEMPDVQLYITGDTMDKSLPQASNVTLTGLVDDVRPILASATVSLVPLRLGGGTRLKILEAFALNVPVVTTSKGAEGLDVCDGEHLLIADTPEGFARAVLCLLTQAEVRERLTTNARRLVAEKYDWAAIMPRFLDLVERVARI